MKEMPNQSMHQTRRGAVNPTIVRGLAGYLKCYGQEWTITSYSDLEGSIRTF